MSESPSNPSEPPRAEAPSAGGGTALAAAPAALRIEGLTRDFGAHRALDGVTFTVPSQSIFGLVGPNGAGKTTLFSIVASFLKPDAGTIEILGGHAPGARELLGRVSILPQDALFDRNLMIVDQLILYRRLQGATSAEATAEVREALSRVGLRDYLDRSVSVLSHGMTKRLGIAQAFLGEPELIFLDEPTAGLDPRNAGRIRRVIRELAEHATVVVSSHNLIELEDLCDHVAILDRGVIKATGTMAEVMAGGGSSRRLELELPAALPAEIRAAIGAVPGVVAIVPQGPGRFEVEIGTSGPEPVEAVLRALLDGGVVPTRFHDGVRLEEIFLSLTEESPD